MKEVRKSCTTVHTLHTNDINFRCLYTRYCSTADYSCCDIFLSPLVARDVGTFHNHFKKRQRVLWTTTGVNSRRTIDKDFQRDLSRFETRSEDIYVVSFPKSGKALD